MPYIDKVVEYVHRLICHGAQVNRMIVMGSTRGIIMQKAPQLLVERGGSKNIIPAWAKSCWVALNL